MLPRQEVIDGYVAELGALEALLRSIDAKGWAAPSRCEGWTVADVAAHVVGGLSDVVNFRLDGAGTPEWTAKQVDDRRGRTPAELADELHGVAKQGQDLLNAFDDEAWKGPAPADAAPTLGQGVEAIYYDAYLHADDIRAALGQPTVKSPGLRVSVHHVAEALTDRGWGPATLELDSYEPVAVSGGGEVISGDAHQFVLAATGRLDPKTIGLDASVNIYG